MNAAIETILSHRSVRDFEEKKLTEKEIQTIVQSAQAASTSSYIQAYTIIGVTDPNKKKKLAEIARNQDFVEKNGHLFVFCADLNRYDVIAEMEKEDLRESIESTERFMVSLIDTALAAQNAAIAAESMGLGICYIGGLRNDLQTVRQLLDLPDRVLPLFGLAVGHPRKLNGQKPRLPLEHVYQENHYLRDRELYKQQLNEYNETVQNYYRKRTGGQREDTWTGQIAKMLKRKSRMYLDDYVREIGMNKNK